MADYFTLVEFRLLPDVADFTDVKVEAVAAYFTEIVEREVGASMIPRSYTDTFDGGDLHALPLSRPWVRSLTSVTLDGVAVSTALLTATHGVLRYLDGTTTWAATQPSNVVAVYSAGKYATCPGDVKDAVMWATRDRLISESSQNGIDVRKTSMTNDLGGTISYVLPGENRPTGYPALDAVIASRRRGSRPMIA